MWIEAPGTLRELATNEVSWDMSLEPPIRFSMTDEGTFSEVDPRGRPRIVRRWFSNCEVSQASIV